MSEMIFTLTDAGIREAFDRSSNQLKLAIDAIALGDAGWSPTSSATRLRNERQRLAVVGGGETGDRQLHVTALADGDDEYWIREAAAISDLGTVVGIWSDRDLVLGYKSSQAPFFAAFDLALDPMPANSVTVYVSGPNLSLFYAPEFAVLSTAIARLARTSADQFDEIRSLKARIADPEPNR